MTNGMFKVVLFAAVLGFFAMPIVFGTEAEAPAKPEPITVVGTVSVEKDANGAITAVTLTTEDEVEHNVVLDKEGLKLADFDGKKAEAKVIVMKKGEENWIKVLESKEVKEPPA